MALQLFGDFGFVNGSDVTANPYQDQQVCINFYPEGSVNTNAKEVVSLLGTPGLTQLVAAPGGGAPGFSSSMTQWPVPSTVTTLPVRGCWVLPGWKTALVVIGDTCYLATATSVGDFANPGTVTLQAVGTLLTASGPVNIRDNNIGGYAVIVDGPNGYTYNINNQVFTRITDPSFSGSNTVAYIDGWWIFQQPGTMKFYTNFPQFSITFDPTYFAFKDGASDNLVGIIELKEELWLIGERTTEIWYDAGGQFFPFQRLVGSLMQIGTTSPFSICKIATANKEGTIFLGRSERGENQVIKTTGFTWEVVSTPALSYAISQYPDKDQAIAYTYESDGHEFYVLTFPQSDVTWVYDATLPQSYAWHQRASYDPYAQKFHRHRSNCYMNFGGMTVVGDYQNGALYQMTRAAKTDAGWPILSRRRSPYIWNKENRERVFMASLQVDFSPGQGTPSGIGSNPVATFSISRDYGSTFGPSIPASMGGIGQFTNRCMWRKLGFSRGAVVQIDVIEPVSHDIIGCTLRAAGP